MKANTCRRAQSQWFNYGGDKIWLLPEGNDDEQHWAGGSDMIDDSPFSFRKVSEGQAVRNRAYGPGRSADRNPVCRAPFGWTPIRRESAFAPT